MTRDVRTVLAGDALTAAAQIMWDGDCGCVPVVDAEGRVAGMVTDRDVAMAVHFRGVSPGALRVSDAMSDRVFSCRSDEDVAAAEAVMRERRVRRIPVVDSGDRLVGLLSLNDLARAAEQARLRRRRRGVTPAEILETLAAIGEPAPPAPAAAGS